MAETAVVLLVILTFTFGVLDMGIAVFRYNTVSQAARQGVRNAIVHGKLAPPKLSQWGPSTYTATGDGDGEIETSINPYLAGLAPSQVTIRMEWLDGNTDPDSRVRATVSTTYTPVSTFIFGSPTLTLSGASTQRISH